MVQKGKLAAWAFALDRQLNKVDLPTFGSPTIPHFNDIVDDLIPHSPRQDYQVPDTAAACEIIFAGAKIQPLSGKISVDCQLINKPISQAASFFSVWGF
jgi:hypothetical protein